MSDPAANSAEDSSPARGASPAPGTPPPPALPALAHLILRHDDPQVVMREMLTLLIADFGAQTGSISLLNPDSSLLVTEVESGGPSGETGRAVRPGQGITGWCVLNRRALLVPDVGADPRQGGFRTSSGCAMAAPLIANDQIVGVVDLGSERIGGFSAADLARLEHAAVEGAQVLQRLWQLQHLTGRARQLESLLTAGQSLVTKLQQQDLFDTLTREARRMMQARAAALFLHDAAAASVQCVALDGEGPETTPPDAIPLESSLVAPAIRTRRQIWFADIQSPEFLELADRPPDPALHSLLATPILIEGEVLGVVAVFTARPHRFDNHEMRLCAALASLGSVALQNARLYARVFESEDVLRRNERLTTLGLLAAEIAHEIRNPLTVMKLLHDGLGLDFAPDDPRRTDVRVIGEKLDQLEALVSRVLTFAQAPSHLHSRWSLAEIVEDTLVLVRLKLAQNKVAIVVQPPSRPLFVEVHKGQIQQVLLNLLLNATHAMPEGGTITLTLTDQEKAGGQRVVLDLRDTGSGVPAEIQERIFDSFLSGRPDGTGLGLAVAKRILLSHRGDICLLHTSSAGTTMRVTLPLA